MVLYIMKWDIHPDKAEAYLKWTGEAIKRTLGVKGVVEFRAYRPASGPGQVVITYVTTFRTSFIEIMVTTSFSRNYEKI